MKQATQQHAHAVQHKPSQARLNAVKQTLFTIEGDHMTVVVAGMGARAGQIVKSLDEGEDALRPRFSSDDTDFSLILDLADEGGQGLFQRHLVPNALLIVWDSEDQHSRDGALALVDQMTKPGRLILSMDVAKHPSDELAEFSNLILLPETTPVKRGAMVYAARYLAAYLYGVLVPILQESIVCVDLADFLVVFATGSVSWMVTGQGSGKDRATAAVEQALEAARQQGIPLGRASGVVLTFTGPMDIELSEINGGLEKACEAIPVDCPLVLPVHPSENQHDSVTVHMFVVADRKQQAPTPQNRPKAGRAASRVCWSEERNR